ncbi:MAG: hypothetical protein HY376_03015 [Candidatus Blackburnbacteria bacterium]|nr:hypothetical protein [Candidatus Blackburnbacteria bacterium]
MAFDMDFRKWGIAGLIIGLLAWAIQTFVISKFPQITVMFATIDVRDKFVSGLGPGLGTPLFGLLKGVQAPNLVVMLVGAVVLTILGAFISRFLYPKFLSEGRVMRWAVVIFYGYIATVLLLALIGGKFNIGTIMSVLLNFGTVAFAIYAFAIGFVVNFLYENIPQLKSQVPSLPP